MRRRTHTAVIALVLSMTGAGCESDDVEIIPSDNTLHHSLELELRIDGHAEDLVPIDGLAVSFEGVMAILQGQDHNVRFYDSSGTYLGSVGRRGEGPGEFRRLTRAGWLADTLWVSDTQLRRLTFISPDLEIARTLPHHEAIRPSHADAQQFGAYSGPSPYAMLKDGSSLVWAIRPVTFASASDNDGYPLFHVSAAGVIQSKVVSIPPSDEMISFGLVGGGSASFRVPFAPRQAWTVAPGGSRVALLTTHMAGPDSYFRVLVAEMDGRVAFERTIAFVPEAIPVALRDSAIAVTVLGMDASLRTEAGQRLRNAVPSAYAEAQEVVIGHDDRIWIGMRPKPEGRRWIILSSTGEPAGEITLPPRTSLRAAGPEHVWGIERDRMDVESVVRYRLKSVHSLTNGRLRAGRPSA